MKCCYRLSGVKFDRTIGNMARFGKDLLLLTIQTILILSVYLLIGYFIEDLRHRCLCIFIIIFIEFITDVKSRFSSSGFKSSDSGWGGFLTGFSLAVATGLICHCNRYYIRYFKDKFINSIHRKKQETVSWCTATPAFDLFILHTGCDGWLNEELIPRLNTWKVTFVCDFTPGKPIVSGLYNAVCGSRFTFILLTNQLVRFSWLNYATMLTSKKGLDSVIICEMEDVDTSEMSETMFNVWIGAKYNLTWTRNSWYGKELFWKDLKAILII